MNTRTNYTFTFSFSLYLYPYHAYSHLLTYSYTHLFTHVFLKLDNHICIYNDLFIFHVNAHVHTPILTSSSSSTSIPTYTSAPPRTSTFISSLLQVANDSNWCSAKKGPICVTGKWIQFVSSLFKGAWQNTHSQHDTSRNPACPLQTAPETRAVA